MNERAPNEMHWAGFAISEQVSLKQKKIMRTMLNTVVDYRLIEANDHVMGNFWRQRQLHPARSLNYRPKKSSLSL